MPPTEVTATVFQFFNNTQQVNMSTMMLKTARLSSYKGRNSDVKDCVVVFYIKNMPQSVVSAKDVKRKVDFLIFKKP